MFSDGTEGYDNCIYCNDLFQTPLVLAKTNDEWFETFGPEIPYTTSDGRTGEISFERKLEMIDSNQFKDTPKIDRDAIYCGFCSAKCRIKRLDKQNDKLSNEIYQLKNKYESLIEARDLLIEEKATAKTTLKTWKDSSTIHYESNLTLNKQIDRINAKPYRFALNHLWEKTRLFFRKFFHTSSFIEFIAKYIIVLLVGYILFEVITRL